MAVGLDKGLFNKVQGAASHKSGIYNHHPVLHNISVENGQIEDP